MKYACWLNIELPIFWNSSANPEPSHVLRALGISDDLTRASLRFGLGRFNTDADVDEAAKLVVAAVQSLRRLGSTA